MKRYLFFSFLLGLGLLSLFSCKKDIESKPFLNLSIDSVEIGRAATVEAIDLETNMSIISVITPVGWVKATLVDKQLQLAIESNTSDSRTVDIILKGNGIERKFTLKQRGKQVPPTSSIAEDLLIPVSSASASSFHAANPINLSFDGNFDTYYMSHWSQSSFPVEVIYTFTNVESMDYLVYYPRPGGAGRNGLLKEVEIWYATAGNPTFTKLGDYNFNGSSAIVKIELPKLIKPTQIKLLLSKGVGTGTFAAIGEIQFFRHNPNSFDYSTIFTDHSCSQLKEGINLPNIESIPHPFFKYLALEIFHKEYEAEFRVQDYKAWQHPRIMSEINKTGTYSLLDNPTGIAVNSGDELVVLANDPGSLPISLQVIDLQKGYGSSSSYRISKGLNKLKMLTKGLVYIMYHTDTGTEKPIRINIASGQVNGYFDREKHTQQDWKRLLNNASDMHFDVLGKHAHLTFPVADFKKHTVDGLELIKKYDELIALETEFMGLNKYRKPFKNRLYFHVDYGNTYMYATAYRTGYSAGTMTTMCHLETFTKNCWGPAHEVGHIHQTRPGMKWHGMTEVTNNIHSLIVQTTFGNTSRLIKDAVYQKAMSDPKSIINAKIPFAESTDLFEKLIPFWQLKLYLMDGLGKTEFYKDLYEHYRVTPTLPAPNTDGVYQLDFVRNVCKISNLDLLDFFETWGFLRPVNVDVNDYGIKRFTITQEQIDQLIADVKAQKYPKPKHADIHKITDINVADYSK